VTLPRIFRTASFRFAIIIAALILVSGVVLGAIVYRSVSGALEEQVADQVDREFAHLITEYQTNGIEHLTLQVNRRQNSRSRDALDYSLQGLRGVVIAGAALPAGPFTTPRIRGEGGAPLYIRTKQLPGGETLIVGTDVNWIRNVQDKILTAFASALLFTAALALVGGLWLSSRFLARLDAMTRTAASIVAGDLSSRVPVSARGDDFDRLGTAFNTMLDRLAATMDSLRQVSNDIAHDLRTPLTRLRQTLDEAARKPGGNAETEQAFDAAGEQVDDILSTFSALLRIAQIESGARRKGFARLDLAALASTIADDFRSVAEEQGRSLTFAGAEPVFIEGDRDLLTQLIVNLIENALNHTPAGAAIAVSVTHPAEGPRLAVADNGQGVPEAERSRIFDRFYRLETSRTTPGSGLGLSLVAAIADLHGATASASDNAPGLVVNVQFSARPA